MGWKSVTREPLPQCAHLGFAEDPFRRSLHATEEHRCYAHLGRERIDLSHQKRFCLTSAHGGCPFLLVNAREQQRNWRTEARDWWRKVSPAGQALALVLQTWQHVRPQHMPPVAEEAEPVTFMEVLEPTTFVEDVVPVAQPAAEVEYAPRYEETAREWFWRAKNAETLDELVECLERAYALEPDNEMVATNLEWARERREAAKAKPKPRETTPSEPKLYSVHKANPIKKVGGALVNLVRTTTGLGTITAGVVVVFGALPAQIRSSVQTPIELPDTSGLVSLVHVPLAGGYDLGMAVPFAIGFLALFIGMGLLQREPSLAARH